MKQRVWEMELICCCISKGWQLLTRHEPDGWLMRGDAQKQSNASLRQTLAQVSFWSSSPDHRPAPGASFIAYAKVSRRLGTGKLTYFTAATNQQGTYTRLSVLYCNKHIQFYQMDKRFPSWRKQQLSNKPGKWNGNLEMGTTLTCYFKVWHIICHGCG